MNKLITLLSVVALLGCNAPDTKKNTYPTPDIPLANGNTDLVEEKELTSLDKIINDSVAVFNATLDTLDYQVQIRIFGEGLKKELHFAILHGEEVKYWTAKWPLAVIDAQLKDYNQDFIPELYLVCNDEGTLSENYLQFLELNNTDSISFSEIELDLPTLNGRVLLDTFVFQNDIISRNILSEIIDPMGTSSVSTSVEYHYTESGKWKVD